MILPCITCNFRTEQREGHRVFVGCKDKEKKEKNFHNDDYFYQHSCDAYEKEDEQVERQNN